MSCLVCKYLFGFTLFHVTCLGDNSFTNCFNWDFFLQYMVTFSFLIKAVLNVCTFLHIQGRCHTPPMIMCSILWVKYWKKSSLPCGGPFLQLRSVVNCSSHQCVFWQRSSVLRPVSPPLSSFMPWVTYWWFCSLNLLAFWKLIDEGLSEICCSNMHLKLMMSATVNNDGIGSSPTKGLSHYSFSWRVSCLTYQTPHLLWSKSIWIQYIHREEACINRCLKYMLLTSVISF